MSIDSKIQELRRERALKEHEQRNKPPAPTPAADLTSTFQSIARKLSNG